MFINLLLFVQQFDTPNTLVLVDNTPLEISIKASTVWGSSNVVTIYTPIPSPPTDIRMFSNFSNNNLSRDVILQHSLIENITYYEVVCYRQVKFSWEICSNRAIVSTTTRTIWPGLAVNTDFLFKVIIYNLLNLKNIFSNIIDY